ncbi:MAG: hypothetical protein DBX41_06320 [Clostridiales bacterium]|nr:MAG: hypothetical protein DBX41_06320 [Clostridiales bacterium]
MELMNWQWEIEMLLRLVLAVLLSGIIGMEREALNKSAGFRTHILVGIGACLMMIISLSMPFIRMPGDFGATGSSSDPARIAAQVVSGIGFLGAGAIMSSSGKVRGLTTAASLWAVAGIGLCVGAGLYVTAIGASVLTFATLSLFARVENRIQKNRIIRMEIYMVDEPCAVGKVFEVFNDLDIQVKDTALVEDNKIGHDVIKLDLLLKIPYNIEAEKIKTALEKITEVYDIVYTQ